MSFDIKSQKILGTPAPGEGVWSIPFEYDPEDAEMLSTRGKLYIVASFKADVRVDLQLASKILIDAIKEHYYGDLDGTPLQALENALAYGKDKLQQSAQGENKANVKINVVCCVVWGSILYIAQSGDTASLIIRGGEVSDISHKTGGEVMTTSGILENEDVVLITTNHFEQEFNGNDLISKLSNIDSLVSASQNAPLLSAVVIRFKKSVVGAKDIASFMPGFRRKKKQYPKPEPQNKKPLGFSENNTKNSETPEVITSLNSETPSSFEQKSQEPLTENKPEKKQFELKSKSLKGRKPKKLIVTSVAVLLIALMSFGVFKLYSGFVNKSDDGNISVVVGETFQSKFDLLNSKDSSIDEYKDLRNEIKTEVENGSVELYDLLSAVDKKISDLEEADKNTVEAYYDFRAKNDNSNINNVEFFKGDLLISDKGASQAYLLTEGDKVSIKDIAGSDEYLTTTSDTSDIYVIEKNKVFVGATPDALKEYPIDSEVSSADDAAIYFGNIYILSGSKIIKLEKSGGTYKASDWGKVDGGSSISIDGSIYVSGENGITKYYSGDKEDFTLSGADEGFKDNVAYLGSNTLYVLSGPTLYSFNKNSGVFSKKIDLSEDIKNASSFIYDGDNAYITGGSSVYKVSVKSNDDE